MIDRLYEGLNDVEIDPPATALRVVDAVDLLSQPFEPVEFIADHIAPVAVLILLTGDSGSAKTSLLLHMLVCIATGTPVAGRFTVTQAGRVLYVNGEMGASTIQRYLHEAVAGVGIPLERDRFYFEGGDGVAIFRFAESRDAILRVVDEIRPAVVVFDTARAVLIEDENDAADVRRVFGWIRTNIVNRFGATVIVAHHLRKLSVVSNSARERVSGSRDLVASVDVHLAAVARDGRPMHALRLDKTRSPQNGVEQGTEWPIEARLDPGQPNRSTFVASAPSSAAKEKSVAVAAADEIRARLDAEGELTLQDLNIDGGSRKRGWYELLNSGVVVPSGNKLGRKTLYRLSMTPSGSFSEALQ